MYLRTFEILNVGCHNSFSMTFREGEEAGWHVILGENGAGKTTILKAMSYALLGPEEILRFNPSLQSMLKIGNSSAEIKVKIKKQDVDSRSIRGGSRGGIDADEESHLSAKVTIQDQEGKIGVSGSSKTGKYSPYRYFWGTGKGWFSCGLGAYRRFSGGDAALESFFYRDPKVAAHLTLFNDAASLTAIVPWLKDLHYRKVNSNDQGAGNILKGVVQTLNRSGLLPDGYELVEINPDGAFFLDPTKARLPVHMLSEGVKSVMALTLELMRQLLTSYTSDQVFGNLLDSTEDNNFIPVPGVVLIDEIDVHLHPTWQTRIGQWFTTNFPNMQFIVTTHSPLICRAAEKGTIWRLSAPGSGQSSDEVIGNDRDLLIYGDVLDAYETEKFGKDVARGEEGQEKQARYRDLMLKSRYGVKLTAEESTEFIHLKSIFQSNVGLEA